MNISQNLVFLSLEIKINLIWFIQNISLYIQILKFLLSYQNALSPELTFSNNIIVTIQVYYLTINIEFINFIIYIYLTY